MMKMTVNEIAKTIISYYNTGRKTLKPSDLFSEYSVPGYNEETETIHAILNIFERRGYIQLNGNTKLISKIIINIDNISNFANQYNCQCKNMYSADVKQISLQYVQHNILQIATFAREIIDSIDANKSTIIKTKEEAIDVFKSLNFILSNNNDISLRTASVNILNDSKKLENLAGKLKSILKQSELSDTEFFEQYNIHRNETFVIFKGPAIIEYNDGTIFEHKCHYGQRQISATELKSINCIKTDHILGIENLTSFNNFHSNENATVVYIGGYAKNVVVNFIKKCESKEYYHWGDIDYDGFQILKDLTNRTSKEFKPYKMDVDTAIKYKTFARPMNEHHKNGLTIMANEGSDIAQYLLDNDCLIEQECIDI